MKMRTKGGYTVTMTYGILGEASECGEDVLCTNVDSCCRVQGVGRELVLMHITWSDKEEGTTTRRGEGRVW